jgi:AsmA protein
VTPVQAALNVAQLDLSGSGLTEAAPGLAGLITFDGTGESKGGVSQVKGKLKAEKLRLAKAGTPARPAVELDFEIEHDLRSQAGRLRRGDIHVGKALANLTGSYSRHSDATVLKMNLSGPEMPIPELAQMLPAMGIVLPAGASLQGGTAHANFDLEGPTDRLVTSGSLAFNNTKLTGFSLGAKMSMIERLAGIRATPDTEIQTLSSNLRMAPEGMAAEKLKLVVPALGELSGGGTISPGNALDFKMTAAVHTGGMIAALNDRPVPFFIGGTCSDPVFRPDVRAIVTDEVKKQGTKAAGSFLKGLMGGKDKH